MPTDRQTAAMRDKDNPYNPAARKNANHPNSRQNQWLRSEEERRQRETKQDATAKALDLPCDAVSRKDGRNSYAKEIARATGVSVCSGGDSVETTVGRIGFSVKTSDPA